MEGPDSDAANLVSPFDAVLLLVDVLNDLEFPGGEQLLNLAWPMARRIAGLKLRARLAGIPAVYLDEMGDGWRSSFSQQIDRCLHADVRGRPIVELLRPQDDDLLVYKPQNPMSFQSRLDRLLATLKTKTLILTGVASDICALLAMNDLYLGQFRLLVPWDCVAAKTEADRQSALEQMWRLLQVDTRPSTTLDFFAWPLGPWPESVRGGDGQVPSPDAVPVAPTLGWD